MNSNDFSHGAPDTLTTEEAAELANVQPSQPLQGGMSNAQLAEAWCKKVPGVTPADAQLTAFALGVEVGFDHARDLERQDWSRVHHALAKHGAHPGRTDDHLADVIDKALSAPRWWRCDTHGPAKANAWGCPECVREMRQELHQLRDVVHDLLWAFSAQPSCQAGAVARCMCTTCATARARDAVPALAATPTERAP